MKKTKIICTISDANCEVEFIRQLYLNGMNVARINSAHASIEGAQTVVNNIRAVSDKIGILIDHFYDYTYLKPRSPIENFRK